MWYCFLKAFVIIWDFYSLYSCVVVTDQQDQSFHAVSVNVADNDVNYA